jgi:hypothetical protein
MISKKNPKNSAFCNFYGSFTDDAMIKYSKRVSGESKMTSSKVAFLRRFKYAMDNLKFVNGDLIVKDDSIMRHDQSGLPSSWFAKYSGSAALFFGFNFVNIGDDDPDQPSRTEPSFFDVNYEQYLVFMRSQTSNRFVDHNCVGKDHLMKTVSGFMADMDLCGNPFEYNDEDGVFDISYLSKDILSLFKPSYGMLCSRGKSLFIFILSLLKKKLSIGMIYNHCIMEALYSIFSVTCGIDKCAEAKACTANRLCMREN